MLDTNYSKLRIAEPLGSKIVIGDNMYFPDNYKTVCDLLDAVDMDIQNKKIGNILRWYHNKVNLFFSRSLETMSIFSNFVDGDFEVQYGAVSLPVSRIIL